MGVRRINTPPRSPPFAALERPLHGPHRNRRHSSIAAVQLMEPIPKSCKQLMEDISRILPASGRPPSPRAPREVAYANLFTIGVRALPHRAVACSGYGCCRRRGCVRATLDTQSAILVTGSSAAVQCPHLANRTRWSAWLAATLLGESSPRSQDCAVRVTRCCRRC
jgi:hypothetical protein